MSENTYRRYLLTVLLFILAFNFVDRLALGLVLQDIKVDLNLTDTQLGLLTGIAFAAFYSVMGIPIARWADRGNRVTIISLTASLWSAAVVLCGMATGFAQLLAIRVGVAVGEAGCMPPAHSLIADYFSRAERPRAVAIYMLGAPLSVIIGYFLAGWLNEFYGWRMTFILLGLPGAALAALARFTLKEPRQEALRRSAALRVPAIKRSSNVTPAPAGSPSLKQVCCTLWSNVTFRHVLFCFSVGCFFDNGILQWMPAFFIRSFGLKTGELGTWFSVIYGLGGLLGTYAGGELASRYAANNERLQLMAMAFVYGSFAVISALIYLSPNMYLAFGLMLVVALGGAMTSGPLFGSIQTLVPPDMRAMAIAVLYLFANLIGMGLGPLAVGGLSDAFRPWAGEESLRYALLTLCPGYLWAGWHLWVASRTVTSDLRAASLEDEHREGRSDAASTGQPFQRMNPDPAVSK
jgi:MFS family permease